MHQFPVNPTVRTQWVKFVQRHRVDFGEPVAKHASLCSAHFEQSCYEGSLAFSLDGMTQIKRNKVLIKGSVPTRHAVLPEGPEVLTDRKRRQLRRDAFAEFHVLEAKKKKVDEAMEESMKAEQAKVQMSISDNTPSSSQPTSRRPYNCSICQKPLRSHKSPCKK
ncbi:THAP domain-containing protein 2-like [Stylophora pistillata]|uniref:THAP domain-containing protein 2-like n=1 Tax=Stylophora pistillata TaxID=50429 RepID=UPI000C042604|nr:THAP domain-containing protein 2-like [Stylophora pistillata]